jgi:23S rRNA (uridine2552-2'-O)-methyltransferase
MKRSKSSKLWLQEHFTDSYVKRAQQEGYRSRAAFKLLEIQQTDKIIRPAMFVVDLGAAPGGWSEVLVRLVGAKGKVFALDILPMQPIAGVEFIQGDFTEEEVLNRLLSSLSNKPVDIVLSDMAPNISGMKVVDQPRSMYLAELALDFASKVLKSGGVFLLKVFQGEGFDNLLKTMRGTFAEVKIKKPDASRARSSELFLLAKGFKMCKNCK